MAGASSSERPGRATSRVLIVDDAADARADLTDLLAPHYAVDSASDGMAALESAKRTLPDLIITDLLMPRLDGFALLKALQGDDILRNIPVIIVSQRDDEASRIRGLEAGADDYLAKPIAPRELLTRVAAILERSRLRAENEARLREALQAGRMFAWESSLPAGEIRFSSNAAEVLGATWTNPEAAARQMLDEDLQRLKLEIERAIAERSVAGRSEYRCEVRFRRPDTQAMLWLEVRGKVICDPDGAPVRLAGVSLDITTRKRSEELAREQNTLLELIAGGRPLAECLAGVKVAVERLHPGTRAHVLMSDDERHALASANQGACHFEPVRGPDGQVLGHFGVCFGERREPTEWERRIGGFGAQMMSIVIERERASRALRSSEERYRVVVESARDFAIITLDTAGRITGWNTGAEKLMGYAEGEVVGKPGSIFFTEEDRADGAPEKEISVASATGLASNERWHVRKDGSRFWGSGLMQPLTDGRKPGYVKLFQDKTREKTATQALERLAAEREVLLEAERSARADAEVAIRAKDDFLATLSHELRTPLSNILSWGRVIERKYTGDDEVIKKGLSVIVDNANAQSQLISDLLDMSRIVAGKVTLDPRPLNLAELVTSAVQHQRPAAEARGINLDVAHANEMSLVLGDPTRLQQVIWNLLSNAIKFTPSGGHIEVRTRERDGLLEIEVQDSGEGIAPELQAHIFERFRQGDASNTRLHGGLGLGLAIVRQLVELHGGTVEVASEGPGQGARFTVRLPALESGTDAPQPYRPLTDDEAEPARAGALLGVRVLAVEDQPEMLEYLGRLLEEHGAEFIPATSAAEALECLSAGAEPHVLVSDIGMPRINGYELMRSLRQRHGWSAERLPAVAVTAFARDQDRERAFEAGYQAYLAKPYRGSELVALIGRFAPPPSATSAG